MLPDEIIKQVWCIVQDVLGTSCRVYLIGSRAAGTNRLTSDFDFALKDRDALPFDKILEVKSRLAVLKTLHRIDIVDFNTASNDFQEIAQRDMKEVVDGKI